MISQPIVLVTGFAPFGGEQVNPSWQAIKPLDGEIISGHTVVAIELACVFDQAIEQLYQALGQYQPVLTLAFGQAGGRPGISIERVAINLNDARIADNNGNQPVDLPVVADGPDAYFSRLPVKRMFTCLQEHGIPASVSYSAGTFVCNHIMYALLHYIATQKQGMAGGFVHIPYSPAQAANHLGAPSMAIDTVTQAARLLISEGLKQQDDIHISAGTTH